MMKVTFVLFLVTVVYCGSPPKYNPDLFEGDMLLDPDQLEEIKNNLIDARNPFAAAKKRRWPKTILYDLYDLARDKKGRSSVEAAIEEFEKFTCLRFKKRNRERGGYIKFYGYPGCYSVVGYSPNVPRKVNLGAGCRNPETAIHEIMHALGFHHEQSRPDRDDYITIRMENVREDRADQFMKYGRKDVDSLGSPYDYLSIMHYTDDSFSKNGKITMETKDPKMQKIIGRVKHLSKEDIYQINKMYKCNEPTKQPITQNANCVDTYATCDRHIAKCSYPKDGTWFKWVSKVCKKTCNLC